MDLKKLPPATVLRQLLDYDPETGALIWRERTDLTIFKNGVGRHSAASRMKTWNTRFAAKPAFQAINGWGYRFGVVLSQQFTAHRIAWKHFHGSDPVGVIDHIDGNPQNNRITNLRDVTTVGNSRNAARNHRNTSGYMGVTMRKEPCPKPWRASIGGGVGKISLGDYATKEEAVAARLAAEVVLNYHSNHGRIKRDDLPANSQMHESLRGT